MDWPKARAIMIVAFVLVNAVLAYSIWGPAGETFGADAPKKEQIEQLRSTLADRGLTLPPSVTVPTAPASMRFLHVAAQPTPEFLNPRTEVSGRPVQDNFLEKASIEPGTGAILLRTQAKGDAAREIKIDNRLQVQQAAEQYLTQHEMLPAEPKMVSFYGGGTEATVEWVPTFQQYPVYAGSVQVHVSAHGIESVRWQWVQPRHFTEAAPKAIRPASEALLRLAGRLGPAPFPYQREIEEIRLGYYAGRPFTEMPSGEINGWDTVPVWRIRLSTGETYYINAFNGEWES